MLLMEGISAFISPLGIKFQLNKCKVTTFITINSVLLRLTNIVF